MRFQFVASSAAFSSIGAGVVSPVRLEGEPERRGIKSFRGRSRITRTGRGQRKSRLKFNLPSPLHVRLIKPIRIDATAIRNPAIKIARRPSIRRDSLRIMGAPARFPSVRYADGPPKRFSRN
ncbi:hypothetical protein PUN28_014475 [Cardiocondyla obscurior]|uniref:Uncharacterized protein n=1 Tax=Cardiocondyla obscurior TaxID=286306 RepID=A0AAW2F4J2_9HYME